MKNNTQKLPKSVSSFMAKIGRLGGRASSPAKTKANRLNAKKRWMNQPKKKKKNNDEVSDQRGAGSLR